MGLEAATVYSDVDRKMPHVYRSDYAFALGGVEASTTYLDIEKIIQICKDHNCDAVHPGYGFLSENADFARRLEEEDITFIGPSPHAIKVMGSKLAAKEAVKKQGVPLLPGSEREIDSEEELIQVSDAIGYPLLIKASAGGGGKGMRVVYDKEDLISQFNRARSEAKQAFGDDHVFVEKYITSPRHIEVQIMADKHGHIYPLFERECSIQRRHQKLIEETPSPVISDQDRKLLMDLAVKVARSVDYVGAGTVEFIRDEKGNFYFLEMNTRLQVEHPITEEVTGYDLVAQQIRVARGEELLLQPTMNGHSIELRICAEDPLSDFAPVTGRIKSLVDNWRPDFRLDLGVESGSEISVYYDSMIGKLIVHAATREEAIALMRKSIRNLNILGVSTTLDFGEYVFHHPAFVEGDYDTNFVDKHWSRELYEDYKKEDHKALAKIALYLYKNLE